MPPRKSGKALVRAITPTETIEQLILALRGHRVMLDRDLAAVCGVPVKRLNEQVKRNRDRFPEDFMFQLTAAEGTGAEGRNVKYQPYAFTEYGAVMLANMPRSPQAVQASIQVVRAFIKLRQALGTNKALKTEWISTIRISGMF